MKNSTTQLTLDFEPGRLEQYMCLKAFLRFRVSSKPAGKIEKQIAADMDLSPSDLSRKLSGNPDDPRNFSVDDLEHYIACTGDIEPIYYLIEKFMEHPQVRRERAMDALAGLLPEITKLIKQAQG